MRNDIAKESKKKVNNAENFDQLDKMISISILDIMLNKYFDEILMRCFAIFHSPFQLIDSNWVSFLNYPIQKILSFVLQKHRIHTILPQ